MSSRTVVYLLHFDVPYKHAKHYLGCTTNLQARLEAHQQGEGAKLMRAVRMAGIRFQLARTWEGGRELERQLKRRKSSPRLCPICQSFLSVKKGEAYP